MSADEASPLQEIERRVQARAKDTSLDMAGDDGRAKLRSLIADEVAAWSDAYKRGLRSFDLADPDLVAERAFRNLAGYGPLVNGVVDGVPSDAQEARCLPYRQSKPIRQITGRRNHTYYYWCASGPGATGSGGSAGITGSSNDPIRRAASRSRAGTQAA